MSPRESFQTSGAAGKFEAMAKSPELRTACDYALLQLENDMPLPELFDPDGRVNGAYGAAMLGAKRVLAILLELHKPEPPMPPGPRGLDYTLKH